MSLYTEDTIEDGETTPGQHTTLQIPTSFYYRRHSSPSALGEGHVFQYPSSVVPNTCSTTISELDQISDSAVFSLNSLKRSSVNNSPTKPQMLRDFNHTSQICSTSKQVTSEGNVGSQTWPRPSHYNIDDKSQCVSRGTNHSTESNGQIVEGFELKEKKLQHGGDNEAIPLITMNSSTTAPLNGTLELAHATEIDANNNTSPSVNSTVVNSQACNSGSTNFSVPNGKEIRTKYSRSSTKDIVNERQIKQNCVKSSQSKINSNVEQNDAKDQKHSSKSSTNAQHCGFSLGLERSKELPDKRPNSCPKTVGKHKPDYIQTTPQENPSPKHSKARSQSLLERRKGGKDGKYGLSNTGELKPKRKFSFPRPLSPRLTSNIPKPGASPGAVVTSSRVSKRRTSITAAAAAFAAATAGAPCSPSSPLTSSHARFSFRKYVL